MGSFYLNYLHRCLILIIEFIFTYSNLMSHQLLLSFDPVSLTKFKEALRNTSKAKVYKLQSHYLLKYYKNFQLPGPQKPLQLLVMLLLRL